MLGHGFLLLVISKFAIASWVYVSVLGLRQDVARLYCMGKNNWKNIIPQVSRSQTMKGFKGNKQHVELHSETYCQPIQPRKQQCYMCQITSTIYNPCSCIRYQLKLPNASKGILAGGIQKKTVFCHDSHPLEYCEPQGAIRTSLLVFWKVLKTWVCQLAWPPYEGVTFYIR